jgi:choline/glycine/proline betaine transport protein
VSTATENRRLRDTIHPIVFPVSAVLILAVAIFAMAAPGMAEDAFTETRLFLEGTFGWFYILVMAALLVTAVFLVFSPYARVKLGPDDAEPDYSTGAWFAMLFSAGMGIGLVFWGVAEPVFIFDSPPFVEGGTDAAAQESMNWVFHHWGFSPWAVYAIIGLGLAYFGFRRGMPMTIRSCSVRWWVTGWTVRSATPSTSWRSWPPCSASSPRWGSASPRSRPGSATSSTVDVGNGGMVLIIAVITAFATLSVVAGLDKGIKRLSQINIAAAGLLAAAVFLVGPTLFLIFAFVDNTGSYLQNMINTLLLTGTYDEGARGLPRRLDDLLLGVVDLLVAVRGDVHRPCLLRAHDPPVRPRRAGRPHGGVLRLVHDLRQHLAGDRGRGRRGARAGHGLRDVRPAGEPRSPPGW